MKKPCSALRGDPMRAVILNIIGSSPECELTVRQLVGVSLALTGCLLISIAVLFRIQSCRKSRNKRDGSRSGYQYPFLQTALLSCIELVGCFLSSQLLTQALTSFTFLLAFSIGSLVNRSWSSLSAFCHCTIFSPRTMKADAFSSPRKKKGPKSREVKCLCAPVLIIGYVYLFGGSHSRSAVNTYNSRSLLSADDTSDSFVLDKNWLIGSSLAVFCTISQLFLDATEVIHINRHRVKRRNLGLIMGEKIFLSLAMLCYCNSIMLQDLENLEVYIAWISCSVVKLMIILLLMCILGRNRAFKTTKSNKTYCGFFNDGFNLRIPLDVSVRDDKALLAEDLELSSESDNCDMILSTRSTKSYMAKLTLQSETNENAPSLTICELKFGSEVTADVPKAAAAKHDFNARAVAPSEIIRLGSISDASGTCDSEFSAGFSDLDDEFQHLQEKAHSS